MNKKIFASWIMFILVLSLCIFSIQKTVEAAALNNDAVQQNTSGQLAISENSSTLINKAFEKGHIGGEITVSQKSNKTYAQNVSTFNSVNITNLNIKKGTVSFTVSGNESSSGKTVVINVDPFVFDSNNIAVLYDGEPIKMADNLTDVLDPNDDGSNPEYLVTQGVNGTQVFVSVPHFSDHEITVYSLANNIVETLGGTTAVILYIGISAIAAAVFVSSVYVRRKI